MSFNHHIKTILNRSYLFGKGYLWLIAGALTMVSCNINKHLKENEYLVQKNTIKYNGTGIDNSELNDFIRQKPNRKILKLFRFNLWLYNQVDQQKMLKNKEKRNLRFDRINAKRIEKTNRKNIKRERKGKTPKKPRLKNKEKPTFRESILEAGEPPVILDSALTRITVNQLQRFVFSRGYYDSKVTDSLVLDKKAKRAKVYYSVTKTKPYSIQGIGYKIEDPLIEYFIYNDTTATLIKHQMIYNEDVLQKERERITETQLNNGYFYFAPEYVYYEVDTNLVGQIVNIKVGIKKFSKSYNASNDSLIYTNHPRFYIQNVYIIPEALPKDFRGKVTDVYMKDTTEYNGLKILHNNSLQFRRKDLTRDITIASGQLYQQDFAEETYKGLTSLNVFRSVSIQYFENPYFTDKLDCYIVCQPIVKQAITVETEGTNTSGNLGIAGSIVFQNKNSFRGAELLELKLKGSLTAQKQFNTTQTTNINNVQSTFNTVEFGPELNIYFPRPLFPFTLFYYKKDGNEKRYFSHPKTILNLSLNYQSRPEFYRTLSNISYGFKFNNYKGLFAYDVIPLEAYIVKATLFGNFRQDLIALNDFFLLNSFQDHLTTLSKISATYNNQNSLERRNFMYLKMSISSSGNILRGVYNATGQPKDTLGRYQIFSIPFSQFVKLDVDYRFYFKIRKQSKLVLRFAGGIGKALANLSVLPYEQSFFGGGPNGIRAWRARTLGPGSYQPNESNAKYDKIGDIQIESNIEYRFHIFKSFYGAWFADAGNIWLLNNDPNKPNGQFQGNRFFKEIALGSGFGIRYDFSFFVLRLDAAVKIYDPQYNENDRWTFDKKPLKTMTIINFGIGYPF